MNQRLLSRTVQCPQCKENVRPEIEKSIQAFPNATPPIPKRYRVVCTNDNCKSMFYVRANAEQNSKADTTQAKP